MYGKIKEYLQRELADIKAGLYKTERVIASQRAEIEVMGRSVLNFCASNYLGLSDDEHTIEAAKQAMDEQGFGMSSVRSSAAARIFTRSWNVRSPIISARRTRFSPPASTPTAAFSNRSSPEQDAIISDALNHASIIDGVRLSKAVRYRYANADMEALEDCLKRAQAQRFRVICTDGVFSMDGNAAPLDRSAAWRGGTTLVMVDECHSAGVLGATGRGITELYDLRGEVDIWPVRWARLRRRRGRIYDGPPRDHIDMLRQQSRPTSSPTRCPLPWWAPASNCSRSSARATNCTTGWWPTWSISVRGRWRRIRHQTHAVGHLRRDALRCQAVAGFRCAFAGGGRIRHGVLLPCRAEGAGAHPRRSRRDIPSNSSTAASPPSSRWAGN